MAAIKSCIYINPLQHYSTVSFVTLKSSTNILLWLSKLSWISSIIISQLDCYNNKSSIIAPVNFLKKKSIHGWVQYYIFLSSFERFLYLLHVLYLLRNDHPKTKAEIDCSYVSGHKMVKTITRKAVDLFLGYLKFWSLWAPSKY